MAYKSARRAHETRAWEEDKMEEEGEVEERSVDSILESA